MLCKIREGRKSKNSVSGNTETHTLIFEVRFWHTFRLAQREVVSFDSSDFGTDKQEVICIGNIVFLPNVLAIPSCMEEYTLCSFVLLYFLVWMLLYYLLSNTVYLKENVPINTAV